MCRIITETELQSLKIEELRSLFNKVSQELCCSEPGSSERRRALASLETIQRSITVRLTGPRPPKPPGF